MLDPLLVLDAAGERSILFPGNAGSSYNLGYCYSFGIVVKQDDQIASDWFAKYHRGRNTERLEYNVNRSSTD